MIERTGTCMRDTASTLYLMYNCSLVRGMTLPGYRESVILSIIAFKSQDAAE